MNWSDEYTLGIEELDRHHKIIFMHLKNYLREINENRGYEEFQSTVKFLTNYAVFHFEAEEELMKEIDYPKYEKHKEEHDKTKERIKDLLLRIKQEKTISPIELYYFISNWITSHILEEDKQIKKFMDKNEITDPLKRIFTCNDGYIYEQITMGIENIIEKENKKLINQDKANKNIKKFISDFFENAKIGFDCQLEIVMDTINRDLFATGLINLHRKDYIKDCIKDTFDMDEVIRESHFKKPLLRMLLEENFVEIGEYTDLKKHYKV